MIVSHGIDSSMVHRRQCSFLESSRFDCSEAACRIRPFGVRRRTVAVTGPKPNSRVTSRYLNLSIVWQHNVLGLGRSQLPVSKCEAPGQFVLSEPPPSCQIGVGRPVS
jgi:hypothetical protein